MNLEPCETCPFRTEMTYLTDDQQRKLEAAAARGEIQPCHHEDDTPLHLIAPRPLKPGMRGCAGAQLYHQAALAKASSV